MHERCARTSTIMDSKGGDRSCKVCLLGSVYIICVFCTPLDGFEILPTPNAPSRVMQSSVDPRGPQERNMCKAMVVSGNMELVGLTKVTHSMALPTWP
jgi:hypothetical protein